MVRLAPPRPRPARREPPERREPQPPGEPRDPPPPARSRPPLHQGLPCIKASGVVVTRDGAPGDGQRRCPPPDGRGGRTRAPLAPSGGGPAPRSGSRPPAGRRGPRRSSSPPRARTPARAGARPSSAAAVSARCPDSGSRAWNPQTTRIARAANRFTIPNPPPASFGNPAIATSARPSRTASTSGTEEGGAVGEVGVGEEPRRRREAAARALPRSPAPCRGGGMRAARWRRRGGQPSSSRRSSRRRRPPPRRRGHAARRPCWRSAPIPRARPRARRPAAPSARDRTAEARRLPGPPSSNRPRTRSPPPGRNVGSSSARNRSIPIVSVIPPIASDVDVVDGDHRAVGDAGRPTERIRRSRRGRRSARHPTSRHRAGPGVRRTERGGTSGSARSGRERPPAATHDELSGYRRSPEGRPHRGLDRR